MSSGNASWNNGYNLMPIRLSSVWSLTSNAGEDVEQKKASYIAGWECKIVHTLIIWSSSCTPWYWPKGIENLCPNKSLHTDVYSSFIHNGQNLEATKMCFSR